jgi:hypothetical protein
MEQALEGGDAVRRMKPGPKPKVKAVVMPVEGHPEAQSLASRIWAGQSPDVAVIERVERIANSLKERGWPCEVTLPHPDADRYMKAHL